MLDEGKIAKWDRQVRVKLVVNGKHVCTIVPDFLVWDLRNRETYVEVKGRPAPIWRLKVKIFEALFPDARYVIVPSSKAIAL